MAYQIKYCPNCNKQLIQNQDYEDEYKCEDCNLSWEIMLINETGKEIIR